MTSKTRLFSVCVIFSGILVSARPSLAVNNGNIPVNTPESLTRAIKDLSKTFGPKYKGEEYLKRLAELTKGGKPDQAALQKLAREALLANPLLDVDKILVIRRRGEANRALNSHTTATINPWKGRRRRVKKGQKAPPNPGWDNDIAEISNLRSAAKARPIFRHPGGSVIKHMELHYDGKRIMFSGGGASKAWAVLEVGVDGKGLRELTPSDQKDVHWFDACYLPEKDNIITASTAGMQGLPCENGGKPMVNLYKVNTKSKKVRQLTFEQDSDWHPRVRNDGRVVYLRWEYTDTPHYYSRYMFQMNPDGTGQMELWGSGSYFPTAYVWARPVPNHSSMLLGVVSGHHAKSETGRLMLLDPALGRKYPFKHTPKNKVWGKEKSRINIFPKVLPADQTGCVQEIPGWGKDVVGNVYDNQGGGQKYTFGTPWPLSDKYFLVSLRGFSPTGKWTLCLVDVFDNMVTVYADDKYDIFEPMPLAARKTPKLIADRTVKGAPATIFCTDVYGGRGLKGIPRGTVKQLRVFAYHYGYIRSGGHESVGLESSWDIKRVLGTVPVDKDGSFSFEAPANTPLAIQPLDEKGQSLAVMRSWMVGMPGERLACNGCHEDLNEATPIKMVTAARRKPSKIKEWYGPKRPFAFATEIQPMLNKYCLGCHSEAKKKDNGGISFEKSNPGSWRRDRSYLSLVAFVRRPGPESDLDLYDAMEWHASTSPLVRMLRKGHHGVKLDDESWRRIYTWIDLNAPHRGMWNNKRYEKRRLDLATLYAGLTDNPEDEYRAAMAKLAKAGAINPIIPTKPKAIKPDGLKVAGFPLAPADAKKLQGDKSEMEIKLPDGQVMKFVRIPAGAFVMGSQSGYPDEAKRTVVKVKKAFWMGVTEVTNKQYGAFDPKHDTRYLDEHGKDHSTPGYIANHVNQPVARISWQEAMAFAKWMSKKSGKKVTLPTEAQWEYAARAGTDSQFYYGDKDTDFSKHANLADAGRLRTYIRWDGGSVIHKRNNYPKDSLYPLRDNRFTDKWFIVDYVGQCKPNAWGLKDMVGNVSEWTRSDYAAYPYKDDARNSGKLTEKKTARGGSWSDRPRDAGASVRLPYESYQKVYNVGFRVIIE
ncbi:MAG: formylglycine-generating enzyme family protein [bacterium]|nr:formylglycine-generating enzyme family protein [bacterium]